MGIIKNLQPILNNINKIKWGHFQIEYGSIIEASNKLVQIVTTDNEGHLYFFATVALECVNNNLQQKFYANLTFEDKKYPKKIQVSGYVCDTNKNLTANEKYQSGIEKNILLFKFKIMKVEVTDFIENDDTSIFPFSNFFNFVWKKS